MGDKYEMQECYRCGGSGVVRPFGTCFKCGGAGKVSVNLSFLKRLETKNRKMAEKSQIEHARRQENLRMFIEKNPDLAFFADLDSLKSFDQSLRDHICKVGDLTDNQMAAVRANMQRKADAEVAQKKKCEDSKYFGTLGERVEASLVYKRSVRIEITDRYSYNNSTTVKFGHMFETEDGLSLVWWTTTELCMSEGKTVSAKFTIKKHDDYKGVKQTHVSRLKLVEQEETSASPSASASNDY